MRNMNIGLTMKTLYVKSFIIISTKIDFIMRMVMYMFAHYIQCEISPILFFISVTIKLNS